jgi:hypothetical protein
VVHGVGSVTFERDWLVPCCVDLGARIVPKHDRGAVKREVHREDQRSTIGHHRESTQTALAQQRETLAGVEDFKSGPTIDLPHTRKDRRRTPGRGRAVRHKSESRRDWHYVRRDLSPHDSASMLMIGDDWPRGGVRLLHQCVVASDVDPRSVTLGSVF